jgi:hypothetical protein
MNQRILMQVVEPKYIHKKVNDRDMTIMTCTYVLRWEAITSIPMCEKVLKKVFKVKKAIQEAHIEYVAGSPAFIFQTTGITVKHDNDVNDPMIGKRVAKAKAFNKACAISRAIIKAAKSGLEEELLRTDATLKAWQEKENKIRKQWQK